MNRHDPRGLLTRGPEPGVGHAKGTEDVFIQIHIEGLPGEFLNQIPLYVDARAIVPGRAWLARQRKLRQFVDHVLQGAGLKSIALIDGADPEAC